MNTTKSNLQNQLDRIQKNSEERNISKELSLPEVTLDLFLNLIFGQRKDLMMDGSDWTKYFIEIRR